MLTRAKADWLWSHVEQFRMSWDDHTVGTLENFSRMFLERSNVFEELYEDDKLIGLLGLMNVHPGHTGDLHVVFWDKSFKGRIDPIRKWLMQSISELRLQRVSAFVPDTNRPAWKFVKRLGFRIEGVLRKAAMYQGRCVNVVALGLLTEEMINGQ